MGTVERLLTKIFDRRFWHLDFDNFNQTVQWQHWSFYVTTKPMLPNVATCPYTQVFMQSSDITFEKCEICISQLIKKKGIQDFVHQFCHELPCHKCLLLRYCFTTLILI